MNNNIAISSRIRLARNLIDYPFPNKLNKERSLQVIEKIKDALFRSNSEFKCEYELYNMDNMDYTKRLCMVEEHLISSELAENENGAVLINKDKTISIMINEEDHIRIQSMSKGLNLENAYDVASKLDDLLEESLNYAFDEKLGYLTSCPTNTGTGMRASVMLHLPALTKLRCMDDVYQVCSQIGLTVRGIYGEKSDALGNIYQISNQVTLGRTEENIIKNVSGMVSDVTSKEIQARKMLEKNDENKFKDNIFRSLGILKYARSMGNLEAMNHLSELEVGVEMGYIKDINIDSIEKLMIDIQPAHQLIINKNSNSDVSRANFIRNVLKEQ